MQLHMSKAEVAFKHAASCRKRYLLPPVRSMQTSRQVTGATTATAVTATAATAAATAATGAAIGVARRHEARSRKRARKQLGASLFPPRKVWGSVLSIAEVNGLRSSNIPEHAFVDSGPQASLLDGKFRGCVPDHAVLLRPS